MVEGEPDTLEVRRRLHERAPSFVFGSINERIYLAEVRSRSRFIVAAFPGPVVRRTIGTPFMGYSGAANIIQDIANNMYDMVFTILPVETRETHPAPFPGSPAKSGQQSGNDSMEHSDSGDSDNIAWSSAASERLQAVLGGMSYLERFSASRELRKATEHIAKSRGLQEVTLAIFEEMMTQRD
jgi:chlorophyllide a reductase subunit Z